MTQPDATSARVRRTLLDVLAAIRTTLDITFVIPVRQGRPRPREWVRGLPSIGAAMLVLYGLLALAAIFAVELRRGGDLVLSPATSASLPGVVVWLLLCGVVFSFALVHTAALHTSWWLRVVLFLVGLLALFFFAVPTWLKVPWAVFISIAAYLGLLVFTLVRARRAFAWWDFLVVTLLVVIATLVPQSLAGQGPEFRVVAIEGTISSLGVLAYPALLVAGSVPAQIAVTAATAAARRPVGRAVFAALATVGVGWVIIATVLAVQDGSSDLNPDAFLSGAIGLVALAGLLALWLARARQRTPDLPSHYPDAWSAWLYPLAAAIVGVTVVAPPITLIVYLLRLARFTWVADGMERVQNAFFDNNPGVLWRAGVGVVLLVIAWRISARGREAEATLLAAFSVATILRALGLLPGLAFLDERNTQATSLIAVGVALLVGCVLAVRRRLDRSRATWLVAVVLLAALYPFRNFLADPAGAALVFSAPLLVLFGVTWRLLTDAEFLAGDSRLFPRPTRVLLFMANSLFAVTSVAFVALARATATDADSTIWVDAGDWALGESLFFAGLVAALWLAVRPASGGQEEPDAGGDVGFRGVDQRDRAVALVEGERQFGAGEGYPISPGFREPGDNAEQRGT